MRVYAFVLFVLALAVGAESFPRSKNFESDDDSPLEAFAELDVLKQQQVDRHGRQPWFFHHHIHIHFHFHHHHLNPSELEKEKSEAFLEDFDPKIYESKVMESRVQGPEVHDGKSPLEAAAELKVLKQQQVDRNVQQPWYHYHYHHYHYHHHYFYHHHHHYPSELENEKSGLETE